MSYDIIIHNHFPTKNLKCRFTTYITGRHNENATTENRNPLSKLQVSICGST